MTFLKDVLGTTDEMYGVVVSIAGVGAIIGGGAAAALVKRLSLLTYIGAGFALTAASYAVFYASHTLWLAVVSFVALGFIMAFGNTGFATLYQKTIPPELMGRFGSSFNLLQSVVQILFTTLIGVLAEWYSLQPVTIVFALCSLALAIYLYIHSIRFAEQLDLK